MCSNFRVVSGSSTNVPAGALVGLLKRHWPGLYSKDPEVENDSPSPKKLALRWEDYEAAPGLGYMQTEDGTKFVPTCAEVVVHKFWVRFC